MSTTIQSIDWACARAEYEAGKSAAAVALKFGVTRRAVHVRVKNEGWEQDVTASIKAHVVEKVAGIKFGSDPEKRALAIDAAAGEVAAVVLRHRREWEEHKALLTEAMKEKDFQKGKLAKITSETIMIRQTGERRAWGIDKDSTGKQSLIEWLEAL